MKKTLLIFLMLFAIASHGQDMVEQLPDFNQAGLYLEKAQKQYQASIICSLGSVTFSILGAYIQNTNKDDYSKGFKASTVCYVSSGILAITSFAFHISAITNIGKAGRELQVKTSENGISLVYRL